MSAFECKNKRYMWRDGFSYGKEKAQIVGEVIESIEERDGHVTTVSFLEESRPEESPTHDMFEWDDSVAAEKYRLRQSAKILGQITYEIITEEEQVTEIELTEAVDSGAYSTIPTAPHSAWVNIAKKSNGNPGSSGAILVSTERAMADEKMRRQVLDNSISEIKMYVAKYRHIVEFAKIFTAIDEVEEELREAQQ